jgi:hypothetical protein
MHEIKPRGAEAIIKKADVKYRSIQRRNPLASFNLEDYVLISEAF